ncbi:ABC transporter ATP-binding protein [Polymorphobacter glacialis]|uniref:ABC transporter ATP-binding protein n=1 Tax=Sandarakinorhabdus glacialis TaxID=1614636 RepID=A0A916ZLF7_9SPHN|nr:ABC transporter ATP-binding protein [Polymorphobacter glacialis]GGE02280.1 ABC transporter ATP-binding protein [Polymorphobacter glacialis]
MAGDGERGIDLRDVMRWVGPIIGPDRSFFWLAIVYGVGISMLSLATPISVQMLINSIANTALPTPLFTLSAVLLVLLLVSGLLGALRTWIMELFRRRFMARLVADVSLRAINAANPYFADSRRIDLFNRFFELINVQKVVPSLLIGGFTILLQAAVGFTVTSFYHPFFLAFNVIVIILVWVIWRLWSRGAMRTSIALSHEKYAAAHWLESVGASNGFYKSASHIDFALARSEAVTANYVAAHKRQFGYFFPQTIALAVLYAVASAGLLALGGWLVIQEQLSIGQLVAAELILSSVFYGIAQLGSYLDDYYDLVAAVEELALLYTIPQEAPTPPRAVPLLPRDSDLAMAHVQFAHQGGPVRFDFAIPHAAHLVAQGSPGMERVFANLLKRHLKPDNGLITIGGVDIGALDTFELRSEVQVLDRPAVVEISILEYLQLANPAADPAAMIRVLKLVGLDDRIAALRDGLQTVLSFTGYPLSVGKTMQLRLAAAMLAEPRILVLSPLYDMVSRPRLEAVFDSFTDKATTIIYFSNRPEDITLAGFLWLGRDRQQVVADRDSFDRLRKAGGREALADAVREEAVREEAARDPATMTTSPSGPRDA